MSGFWQMVVFDTCAVVAVLIILAIAPDGPRLPRRRNRR